MKKYVFATIQFPIEITQYGTKTHMDRFVIKMTDCDELPPIHEGSSLEEEIQKIFTKSYELKTETYTSDISELYSVSKDTQLENENAIGEVNNITHYDVSHIENSHNIPNTENRQIILREEIKYPKHILQNQTFKIHKKKNNITHKKR